MICSAANIKSCSSLLVRVRFTRRMKAINRLMIPILDGPDARAYHDSGSERRLPRIPTGAPSMAVRALTPEPWDDQDYYPLHEEDDVPEIPPHEATVRDLRNVFSLRFPGWFVTG